MVPFADAKVDAYCKGVPADLERGIRITLALQNMQQISPTCAALAQRGFDLLNEGYIHVYDGNDSEFSNIGGAAPQGGTDYWIAISNAWTDAYYDKYHTSSENEPRDLQGVLAHELDHTFGQGHTDPKGYDTPNSLACGDIFSS